MLFRRSPRPPKRKVRFRCAGCGDMFECDDRNLADHRCGLDDLYVFKDGEPVPDVLCYACMDCFMKGPQERKDAP